MNKKPKDSKASLGLSFLICEVEMLSLPRPSHGVQ